MVIGRPRFGVGLLVAAAAVLVSVVRSSSSPASLAHRRLQSGAADCAADINLDESVNTEDLLILLSRFGRSAPADACGTTISAAFTGNATQLATVCNATVQAHLGDLAAEHEAYVAILQADHALRITELQDQHSTEMAQMAVDHAAQLSLFRCANVVIEHGDATGELTYGGSGLQFTCHDGYEMTGASTAMCQADGTWDSAPPTCETMNPCLAEEDNCDQNAACAHTGPGAHSCECNNNQDGVADFFGDGQTCLACSEEACPEGSTLASPCTATSDVVCQTACDTHSCDEHSSCVLRTDPTYELIGTGWCSDWSYLMEGGYPPRLDADHELARLDPLAECMMRCLDLVGMTGVAHSGASSTGYVTDNAFYVNGDGRCGCSTGVNGCSLTGSPPYQSYNIIHRETPAPECVANPVVAQLLGLGYCSDWSYLPEGGYPDRLPTASSLYHPSAIQECMLRCIDANGATGAGSGLTIRNQAFYLHNDNCACSAGACAERSGGSPYHSYAITYTDPDAPNVISQNNGWNNHPDAYACTPDVSGDFPDGAYYSFANRDTVWTSSVYPASSADGCGDPARDLSNAFDAVADGGWDRSFHGQCDSAIDWRVTPLRVRYSFGTSIGVQEEAEELGAGYCSDWAYLPEGGYPPLLPADDPLADPDPVVECMQRCAAAAGQVDASSGRTIGDQGFYVKMSDMTCGCSAGTCAGQSGGGSYWSYRVTSRPIVAAESTLEQGVPQQGSGTPNTVRGVKVFQVPGHFAGNVEVSYLGGDGAIIPVSNPSSAGFGPGDVSHGTELMLLFDPVETTMVEISLWAHEETDNDICVGASELQILGDGRSDPINAIGAGYCSDWAYLPEGGYPPLLDSTNALADPDPIVECRNRCMDVVGHVDSSSGRAISDQGFYIKMSDMTCGCSAGACASQAGGHSYWSFATTHHVGR